MSTLYFLIGTLTLLIALLFFGFIVLLWGLRQLLIIGQQNHQVIDLLEQISVNSWNGAGYQAGFEDDTGEAAPTLKRELKLHRRVEAADPSESLVAPSEKQGSFSQAKATG